jgi:NAD(P)-dependent dehydrogenase (short-subunit alcohol dehydrogenase family)
MGRFDGQVVAAITSAASGMGAVVATRFAEEEAKVVVAVIDSERGTRNADGGTASARTSFNPYRRVILR